VTTYRLYLETDLNRVFAASLPSIAAAELRVILEHRLGSPDTDVAAVDEGRTSYLRFRFSGDSMTLREHVGALAATAALFVEHSPTMLEPLVLADTLGFGTDLVTIQRYKGKTNERLTRMMLNVARATDSSRAPDDHSLLDPMCGRGTTLNWALLYGLRSTGADLDRHALDEYATFLQQWAQGHRFPHRMQRYKKHHSDSRHFDFTVAADRAALDLKTVPDIRTFHAPADNRSLPTGRHSMIVSDLPYGIQHRARSGSASPTTVGELVANVATRWPSQLRTGGSVVLSWNTRSLSRPELVELLDEVGLTEVATAGFEHQVDRTITRDVIVTRRRAPSSP